MKKALVVALFAVSLVPAVSNAGKPSSGRLGTGEKSLTHQMDMTGVYCEGQNHNRPSSSVSVSRSSVVRSSGKVAK